MKLTIKMKPSTAWNRRFDYVVMRGKEEIAVCITPQSAETIKRLQSTYTNQKQPKEHRNHLRV